MSPRDYETAADLARDLSAHLTPDLLPTRNFLRRIVAAYSPGPYAIEPGAGAAWVVLDRDGRRLATCADEAAAGLVSESLWLFACSPEPSEESAMVCTYELDAVCSCPVDGKPDYYRVTVTSGREIPVETILAAVKTHGAEKQFQESFTDALSRALGARVETVGNHSGVKTTVICGAE